MLYFVFAMLFIYKYYLQKIKYSHYDRFIEKILYMDF